VEGRDSRAQQRGVVLEAHFVGHRGQRRGAHDHVVGIAAVHRDPGDPHVHAVDQRAAATPLAVAAVATEPADAHALADLPAVGVVAQGGDLAGDLVAGHERVRPWSEERYSVEGYVARAMRRDVRARSL
jgi:hypothetical protein